MRARPIGSALPRQAADDADHGWNQSYTQKPLKNRGFLFVESPSPPLSSVIYICPALGLRSLFQTGKNVAHIIRADICRSAGPTVSTCHADHAPSLFPTGSTQGSKRSRPAAGSSPAARHSRGTARSTTTHGGGTFAPTGRRGNWQTDQFQMGCLSATSATTRPA